MKIESLLSQYEKIIKKATEGQLQQDEKATLKAKAEKLQDKITDELAHMETGYGKEFCKEYIVKFDKTTSEINKIIQIQ